MPYATIENLPDNVRGHLPEHAQEIYLKAYNNALEEYGDERTAFRVAWAAVKRKYRKVSGGEWEYKRS